MANPERHDDFGSCFYSPDFEAVTHGSKYMMQGLVALGAHLHYMIGARISSRYRPFDSGLSCTSLSILFFILFFFECTTEC
jgi:hypothetical protein